MQGEIEQVLNFLRRTNQAGGLGHDVHRGLEMSIDVLERAAPASPGSGSAEGETGWKQRYEAEEKTVSRVWEALGCKTYEDAKGKTIWELVAQAAARIERLERALRPFAELIDTLPDPETTRVGEEFQVSYTAPDNYIVQLVTPCHENECSSDYIFGFTVGDLRLARAVLAATNGEV